MSQKTAKHVESATQPAAVVGELAKRIRLSGRDTQVFVQAVLKPWPVGRRLRETVQRYRTMTGV